MRLLKMFIFINFLILQNCYGNQPDIELTNTINKFIQYQKDNDIEKYFSVMTSDQKKLVDTPDFRKMTEKIHAQKKPMVGGYINKIEILGEEAKVEIWWNTLDGSGVGQYVFIKENDKWKCKTNYTKEKLESESFKKERDQVIDHPIPPLTLYEHFALLTVDHADYLDIKNRVGNKLGQKATELMDKGSYEEFIRTNAAKICSGYTEEELEELVKFFETQTGLKYLRNYKGFYEKYLTAMTDYLLSFVKNAQQTQPAAQPGAGK